VPEAGATETATFGGGCFWCLEAVFERLQGVERVVSGYAGGHATDPTYEEVCSGRTGHAEVVQVNFDPRTVSYRELLEVFFSIHDPTTPDRQGADVGPQYRSIVLAHSEEQRREAEGTIKELTDMKLFDAPIVTQVVALERFYAAEEYHQGYFRKNPQQPYCRVIVAPKLAKFRSVWQAKLKPAG